MAEFLAAALDSIWLHRRLLTSTAVALVAGSGAAYLIAEVLRRLDRGGREPVGGRLTAAAALIIVTVAAVTNASMPFANTGGTLTVAYPPPADPGGTLSGRIVNALHPADYAYMSAILTLAVGAGLWAVRRRRRRAERVGNPDTSKLLLLAGVLLLGTLWIFQRGVEQLKPETGSAPQFFGTIAGAGLLAMAIIQGLRTLLPLRGVFHRVTLERWIDDATSESSANPRRSRRIRRSVTRLARGPVSADQYALLDLPIEQLCGQIAAGADRLLDAPFAATLASGSRHPPAKVAEVITALAAGGALEIDRYVKLADKMLPEVDAAEKRQGQAEAQPASQEVQRATPEPRKPSASPEEAQEYLRLRTIISQRIQRNIDGLQISTTFWWRRVVRTVAFSVSGVLGLSMFSGRITYSVMCAIVGGFVATASRDLVAVIEKARR